MKRMITAENKRKIEVEELNQKYFALQEKGSGDCTAFHTIDKFKTKEEAQRKLEQIAKDYLEKNQHFRGMRILYIEEVETAQAVGGSRARW